MEAIAIVGCVTFGFAAANLAFQLGVDRFVRVAGGLAPLDTRVALEHPARTRIDGASRTPTDRHDLQLAIGHDFAAPDVEDAVWPRPAGGSQPPVVSE